MNTFNYLPKLNKYGRLLIYGLEIDAIPDDAWSDGRIKPATASTRKVARAGLKPSGGE